MKSKQLTKRVHGNEKYDGGNKKPKRDKEKQNGKKVIIDWIDEHRKRQKGENHSWTDITWRKFWSSMVVVIKAHNELYE